MVRWLVCLGVTGVLLAQPALHLRARRVLKRTAIVLHKAHHIVKEGQKGKRLFARAVAHQRHAVRLFRRGRYLRAIDHSFYARRLAVRAIRMNQQAPPPEGTILPEERPPKYQPPPEATLEKEISAIPNEKEVIEAPPTGIDVE